MLLTGQPTTNSDRNMLKKKSLEWNVTCLNNRGESLDGGASHAANLPATRGNVKKVRVVGERALMVDGGMD